MKMTVYVSEHCPESREALDVLKKNNVDMRVVNITGDMASLREFINLREGEEFFDTARKEDRVGVPTVMFGDREVFIDVEDGVDMKEIEFYLKK